MAESSVASLLKGLRAPLADLEAVLAELYGPLKRLETLAHYRIPLEQYLVYSTAVSVFLTILMAHKGVDIFLGYPIVIVNTMILLSQDRLLLHRYHALAIFVVLMVSLAASAHSETPAAAIVAQVMGIGLFSVFFFSMLTNSGLSVPRWMEIYARLALWLAIWGLIAFVLRILHLIPVNGVLRLRAFYSEPALFVYSTLPAFSLYLSTYLRHKTHKLEVGVFALCYALADSSLGFLGVFLMAFFIALPRLSIWKMMGFGVLAAGSFVGLFFISENFRLRIVDTAVALVAQDISNVNATTFAALSNAYVAIQTFISHPFIGVGIGGYQYAYTKYIPFLGNDLEDPTLVTLNMFDANSLFLRTAAELGSFGLLLLFGFLIVCGRVKGNRYLDIRNALLPYMIVRMSRFGAWFSMEVYFFVGLYLLNYMHSRAANRPKTMHEGERAPELRPAP